MSEPYRLTRAELMIRESKKVAAPHIRQEEATKYRCKECNKLFKAPEFVVKHVIVKHPELIGDKLDEVCRKLWVGRCITLISRLQR